MKKITSYLFFTALIGMVLFACNDDLEVKQDYKFEVTHLPVPKKLRIGETAEIRCQLVRSGYYEGANYCFRYFQPDGKGVLRMDRSSSFVPNDIYELPDETFRFYYTSQSDEQQVIDIYFFDNFNNQFTLSFSFNNDSKEE